MPDKSCDGTPLTSVAVEHEGLPLLPRAAPSQIYPVEHLGSVLAPAAKAIAAKIQVPLALAAQSVLSTAALVAQGYADVQLPFGQPRSLSLFFLTIAGSGDRKSTADNEALKAIKAYENKLIEDYTSKYIKWDIIKTSWSIERRQIKSDRSLSMEGRAAKLTSLGAEPQPPYQPVLTTSEITLEGLVDNWSQLLPALGIFSSEGAQFTAGHGMSGENRLRTAGGLCEFWDGRTYTKIRVKSGVQTLRGRRLSMHLMVQPQAATAFLANPLLLDQGLFSRLLIAHPESLIGTREFRPSSSLVEDQLSQYKDRIYGLIERSPIHQSAPRIGLNPRCLLMDEQATVTWIRFHNWAEELSGVGKDLYAIRDFAAKIAEHAARLAGVISVIENESAEYITDDQMISALWLAVWYLNEARRLREKHQISPEILQAQSLLEWLRSQKGDEVRFSAILQFGPVHTRTKRLAEAALNLLSEHQLVIEAQRRPRIFRVVR